MDFSFVHTNINVLDLEKTLRFYRDALGLKEMRRKEAADGSFTLVFLGNETNSYQIELTWLKDREKPYDLGDNETHLAFRTNDFEAARTLHETMGCISHENKIFGIYFIEDPDGYQIEILPVRK
ncbi:MAG: VOC family protein [Desulfobacterales bacterium]|nr:VOC family protein [Desulfobacterales bacterium]